MTTDGFFVIKRSFLDEDEDENAAGKSRVDNDLKIENFSDEESDSHQYLRRQVTPRASAAIAGPPFKGQPLSIDIAAKLKRLVLGSGTRPYSPEWSQQYFKFDKNIEYGLAQSKGGPCGVLASVQAHLLVEMHHKAGNGSKTAQECLPTALATIIWRSGNKRNATLAIESHSDRQRSTIDFRPDGISERISWKSFVTYESLLESLQSVLTSNPNGLGCISLLYSCILSHGLDAIRSDMDDPTCTLIGQHGYCTQEMVNLLVVGKAVSNVFNKEINCDTMILKGITKQSEIGLLSLFEHYKSCQVGSFYKNSVYPVWIILSESHFSVLFAKSDLKTGYQQTFDLYYFDGLALQDEEIRLTISLENDYDVREPKGDQLLPLECCIRTKWPNAHVNWNDTQPIH